MGTGETRGSRQHKAELWTFGFPGVGAFLVTLPLETGVHPRLCSGFLGVLPPRSKDTRCDWYQQRATGWTRGHGPLQDRVGAHRGASSGAEDQARAAAGSKFQRSSDWCPTSHPFLGGRGLPYENRPSRKKLVALF